MPLILQICAVIVTIAVIAVAFALIKALNRFSTASDEITRTAETVRSSVAQAEAMTRQLRELANELESIVPPIQRVARRFGDIGEQAAGITQAVLNEVEAPVRNTMALITGVRTGTRSLLDALARRTGQTHTNGGYRHE